MTIMEMMHEAYETAVKNGWHEQGKDATVGEAIALIHSEASEALEAYRSRGMEWDPETVDGALPYEMADVVIRVCDFCAHHCIDLEYAIRAKMDYNRTRTYRHGGKRL